MSILSFFRLKYYEDKDCDEICSLIEDLGLIPTYLITPELAKRYHTELSLRLQDENYPAWQKEQLTEFLLSYNAKYGKYRRSRDKGDLLFIDQTLF